MRKYNNTFVITELKDKERIFRAIESYFHTDYEFISKYHHGAGTIQTVMDKVKADWELAQGPKFFELGTYGKGAGCIILEESGKFLYLMFIIPSERHNEEVMDQYWKLIAGKVRELSGDDTFQGAVFFKNTPAMKFVKKRGRPLSVVPTADGPCQIFEFSVAQAMKEVI